MNNNNNAKLKLFLPCYFAFFVNGAMVLAVGAVLPYIIKEAGLSYGLAGGLLSTFAIGNLLASFVNPLMAAKLGRKATIVLLSSLIPITWFAISLLPSVMVMYVLFILMGIGRGSVSIINNAVVNDNSDGKPAALNFLHMSFAVGAFVSPFLTSAFISLGFGWRIIVYIIVVATSLSCVGYASMNLNNARAKKEDLQLKEHREDKRRKPFYKSAVFYIMGLLLFLYLGLENCVNGWFVTYFKSMEIMSDAYATNLVSITWIMVMLGRLLTAKLSQKIDKNKLIMVYCIATAFFFVLLVATSNLVIITIAIVGLGFFFAGIYPTSISSVGAVVKGDDTGMSMFLAMAALGGIITPQIVGIVADKAGLVAAILLLSINAAGMFALSCVNIKIAKKSKVV